MSAERPEGPIQPPLGQIERSLIDEYIRKQGYDRERLSELPEEKRQQLLRDASLYASSRLSEIESRSHFLDEIHDGSPGAPGRGLE